MWDKVVDALLPVAIGLAVTVGEHAIAVIKKKTRFEEEEAKKRNIDKAIHDAVLSVEEDSRNTTMSGVDKENYAVARVNAYAPEARDIDEPLLRQRIRASVYANLNYCKEGEKSAGETIQDTESE